MHTASLYSMDSDTGYPYTAHKYEAVDLPLPLPLPPQHKYEAAPYDALFPPPALGNGHGNWTFPPPAPRITLAGSLDPTTGIFYRTPEHPRLRTAQACEKCRTRKAKVGVFLSLPFFSVPRLLIRLTVLR
ncbi:hypothetical protein B0H11DRAFT_212821 [Mycena galericulata]|nr:hypothetical protein B0H11DRAFT_212821 [Mycena galericulata]